MGLAVAAHERGEHLGHTDKESIGLAVGLALAAPGAVVITSRNRFILPVYVRR